MIYNTSLHNSAATGNAFLHLTDPQNHLLTAYKLTGNVTNRPNKLLLPLILCYFKSTGFLETLYRNVLRFRKCAIVYLLHGAECSWEANQFGTSRAIPRILWTPKFHYHIHNCPPTICNLSQSNPVNTPTSPGLRLCLWIFCNNDSFSQWGVVSP
jgi:hypothetical protein